MGVSSPSAGSRPASAGEVPVGSTIPASSATHGREVLHEGVPVAGQCAPLSLEHVDLGLHQRRALGQRHETRGLIQSLLRVTLRGERRELVGGRDAPSLVARGFGLGLGDELVDLAQLPVELDQVVGEPAGQVAERGGWSDRVRHQSSGIRIQPWRIA